MNLDITCRKVQQYLSNYYKKTKKTASLFDAVFGLYQQHNFHGLNKDKAISSFNLQDQLTDSLLNLNLDISSIINQSSKLSNNISKKPFLFDKKDTQIMMLFQHEKTTMHYHDYFEIDIVLRGKIQFTCQNETQVLKSNSLIIIGPSTQHKIQVLDDGIVICLGITKETLDKNFSNLLKEDNLLSNFFNYNLYSPSYNYLLFHVKITDLFIETLQHIVDEAYSDEPYSKEACYNHIHNFFIYVLRNSSSETPNRSNFLPNKIAKIINSIKLYSNSVNLTSLSQKYGYDKAYLGKLIKKNTGHSFNHLKNYHRIQNSCRLLKFSSKSIETISIEVGYNSPNYFESCFQQFMNISPGKYRQKTRQVFIKHKQKA